jgi:hypothetical protein
MKIEVGDRIVEIHGDCELVFLVTRTTVKFAFCQGDDGKEIQFKRNFNERFSRSCKPRQKSWCVKYALLQGTLSEDLQNQYIYGRKQGEAGNDQGLCEDSERLGDTSE